ncbi:hypothetical protein AMS68_004243 [Peltaster fructicola]|uniref:Uncharacterized protein n=1 Tax=Peltaster fructicola TaxID=286661 RepID=A0A6H0XVL1_9PEZI|nr:hypothetical protein AMS68_004243 [Peltaster fructicola]
MEPVSILAIAGTALSISKTAYSVGESLYIFIHAARKVDATIQGLIDEVQALGNACTLVDGRLRAIAEDERRRRGRKSVLGREDLWSSLQEQITACQVTIDKLETAVKPLSGTSTQKSSAFDKMVKQINVNLKTSDIEQARKRVNTHTTSLQIVLLSIAIEVTNLIPQRMDNLLRNRLKELNDGRQKLSRLVGSASTSTESDVAILRISNRIISTGERLYKSSAVNEWLKGLETIESNQQRLQIFPRTATPSTHPPQRGRADSSVQGNSLQDSYSTIDEQDRDFDPESEFPFAEAEQSIKLGREKFQQEQWHSANAVLQEAINIVLELPIEQQAKCDTEELRHMLGICAFHEFEPASAGRTLAAIFDHDKVMPHVRDNDCKTRMCEIGDLLTQNYVRRGKLDQARECSKVVIAGRQSLPNSDKDVAMWTSVALQARIRVLQGNNARGDVLRSMIPTELIHLVPTFDMLHTDCKDTEDTGPPTVETSDQPRTEVLLGAQQSIMANTEAEQKGAREYLQGNGPHMFLTSKLSEWAQANPYHRRSCLSQQDRDKQMKEHGLKSRTDTAEALIRCDDAWARACALRKSTQKRRSMFGRLSKDHIPDLHLASLFGAVEVMEALIQCGSDVNESFMSLRPLHYAAFGGVVAAAEVLLTAGATVDIPDCKDTPLMLAVLHDWPDIVDVLLHKKADPLLGSGLYGTAVHLACAMGQLKYVAAFSRPSTLKAMGWIPMRNLHMSVSLPQTLRTADKEYPVSHAQLDSFGISALAGHLHVLKYLASCSVDTKRRYLWNVYGDDGHLTCAMALAAAAGHADVVQWMVAENGGRCCPDALVAAIVNKKDPVACLLWRANVSWHTRDPWDPVGFTTKLAKKYRLPALLRNIENPD